MDDSLKKVLEEIGLAIKNARKEKGLTQAQLGELCGKPQSTIGRIETAQVNDVQLGVLVSIFKELGVELGVKSVDDLPDFEDMIKGMDNSSREWFRRLIGVLKGMPKV